MLPTSHHFHPSLSPVVSLETDVFAQHYALVEVHAAVGLDKECTVCNHK